MAVILEATVNGLTGTLEWPSKPDDFFVSILCREFLYRETNALVQARDAGSISEEEYQQKLDVINALYERNEEEFATISPPIEWS